MSQTDQEKIAEFEQNLKSKVRNYMSPDSKINEKEQPELNLLSILAQVKAQVDKQMQDEKVELYKDLLLGGNNENVQLM